MTRTESETRSRFHGFTLLELLIVIAIMGLLGTVSVSGFRGLKKGMEERSTLQVVDEFVRSAYRRAVVDRVPVSIYFWNETISDESSGVSAEKKLVVVGHAVAVRRAGRITQKDGQYLIDEFGDLANETARDENGDVDDTYNGQDDPGRYMYRVGDTTFARSIVSSFSVERKNQQDILMTRSSLDETVRVSMKLYGYYLKDAGSITWNVGDAYGFEIAELTLPKNFIFGSGNNYSKSVKNPVQSVNDLITISGSGTMGTKTVTVCGLHLSDQGEVAFKSIGKSDDPSQDR